MANVFHSYCFNKLLLSCVLTTFSVAVISPTPAYGQMYIGLNDVAFGINMENFVKKIRKYRERRDVNKLLDTVLDMKREIEAYSGLSWLFDDLRGEKFF